MEYKYIAFNASQEFTSGIIAADGEEEAERLVQNYQLKLVSLTPVKPGFNLLKIKLFEEPLSQKDIIYFMQQSHTLINAGIPIMRALSIIQEQTASQNLRETVGKIIIEVRKGNSLSSAMQKQRKAFSAFTIRLIEMGEKAGNLEEILGHLLSYNEKEMGTKKKIKKALAYPAMVVTMAIIVFFLMITVVMPPFLELFGQLRTELPMPTRIMIGITRLPQYMTLGRVLPAGVLIFFLALYLRSSEGKNKFHLFLLKTPILGKIILLQNLGRISRSLAIQLNSGINISEALQIIEKLTANEVLKKEIIRVRNSLIEGSTLRSAVQQSTIFPSLMRQMIQVGEETGKLEPNLTFMADSFDKETDERIETLVAMIEPAMTIVLGVMVAFMALAIVTPSFKIMESLK